MYTSKLVFVLILGVVLGRGVEGEEAKSAASKRGIGGFAFPVWTGVTPSFPASTYGDNQVGGFPGVNTWPLSAELPAITNQYTSASTSGYPGYLGGADLSLAKNAAHTIAVQSAHAINAAEVTAALQAAKEASAAAAIAQQRVQAAKEAVVIQQKIAAAKEAAAAAAIQRSEAAAATASAIQRSQAAADAIHRQEAAAAAAAALQRSEAAAAAAAAIQRSQAAAHAIHKTAAKAAAASAALNHAANGGARPEFNPWG